MNTVRQAKNVHLLFILVTILAVSVLVSSFAANVFAATASLSWTAPTTYTDGTPITNLGGYKVYTGTASGSFSQNIDVGNVTSYTVSSLNNATTYYFAVTAYDASGDVSGFSNQGSYTTPTPPPPANLYTLSASAGSGGSISPSGSIVVSQGASQTFTISPNAGYTIASVTVDGASVGAVSTYTLNNIAANHTISTTFAQSAASTYTISASAGANGTISSSSTVTKGASQTFTVTPNTGYYVVSIVVDGTTVASNIPQGGYSYTFNNVTANHTISATFGICAYNIVAKAGTGGSVSPANAWVNYKTSQTVTITPSSGHKITGVKVDGVSVGAVSSYTFKNVTTAHTISATFR